MLKFIPYLKYLKLNITYFVYLTMYSIRTTLVAIFSLTQPHLLASFSLILCPDKISLNILPIGLSYLEKCFPAFPGASHFKI